MWLKPCLMSSSWSVGIPPRSCEALSAMGFIASGVPSSSTICTLSPPRLQRSPKCQDHSRILYPSQQHSLAGTNLYVQH